MNIHELFGEPIHVYTRSQALADGVLVALDPALVERSGFTCGVHVTRAVAVDLLGVDVEGVSQADRAAASWLVLVMLRAALESDLATLARTRLPVPVHTDTGVVQVVAVLEVEDMGAVITLMYPHED